MATYAKRRNIMILNGKKIVVSKDESKPSGYRILAMEGDNVIDCYIAKKDNYSGYYRVFMGNSYQAKNYDVEFYYLHKVVYAYFMDWKSVDIQEGCHVHHILHDAEIKKDSKKYNDISNLIYIDSKTHARLHYIEKILQKMDDMELTEKQQEFYSKLYEERLSIIKKYCAIRNFRMKKVGRA